ncbi:MAG TPA: head GIN domain-containing protein [Allosphingosinicella sp.]|nr:head GIN domain-containing protein [Allosphingosinicella sp.]
MTRTILAFAALLAAFPAAAAERRYPVTDFDRVVVEGPYIVRLTAGPSSSAVARGTQAALDRAVIDVSGQTLRIRRNRSYWGGNPGAQEGPLVIELATRTLRSARLIGPARLEADRVQGLRVDLIVEGSGDLRATNVRADNLSLGLAGAGRLQVSGTAETLVADIQGTGEVEASSLRAENASITTTTTGNVAVAASETATVTALGLGQVTILGRPACTVRGPNADLVRCGSDQRQQR